MPGHKLLLEFIAKLPPNYIKNKTIIEIGSTREYNLDQNSSEAFIHLCKKNLIKLISVDMDPECSDNVRNICNKHKFTNYEIYTMKGEDFLKNYDKPIDFLYLDAFDYYHTSHSDKRKNKYKDILNCKINPDNKLCHEMHLQCCKNIIKNITKDSLICIDDILNINASKGKGVTAVPYLLKNGCKLLEFKYRAMIFSLQ